MSKKPNCDCRRGGHFPLQGPGFTRRHILRLGATGLAASYFAPVLDASLLESVTAVNPTLLNTARNCILVFLRGGPSQVDTWDLKEGPWLPASFAPTSYGALRWPQGLMPELAKHAGKLAVIRSGLAWAAVHELARAWAEIARNPASLTGRIAPHIGAVVALEMQKRGAPTDVLPGFVAINPLLSGSGYLPARYAPLDVVPSPTGLDALSHPDGAARLDERWSRLQKIDPERRPPGELGRYAADMADFSRHAKRLIDEPGAAKLFTFTNEERLRYGSSNVGDSLIVSRNLIGSNRGTRFVQVTMNSFDHHAGIYSALPPLMGQFDKAVGALLSDLESMPGATAGKTLLDETLVVSFGEFGRTVGAPNGAGGRDHHLRMSILFAGGGVKGGRIIGKTDENGAVALEYGWKAERDVRPEDVSATIYSALGIDYTTVRRDDPMNRGFEYIPFAKDGLYEPVGELF